MAETGKRLVVSFFLFMAGIHFVALQMQKSGVAVKRNLAWRLVSGIIDVEIVILKIIFILATAVGFIWGLILFVERRKTFKPKVVVPSDREEWNSQYPKEPQSPAPVSMESKPDVQKDKPKVQDQKTEVIEPVRLTPEELKQNAIKQIMGG